MKTIITVLGTAVLVGLVLYFLNIPFDPVTGALLAGLLVTAFRVYRALGIGREITHLEGSLTDKYTVLGMGGASDETHNKVVREVDQENADRDALKRIQW